MSKVCLEDLTVRELRELAEMAAGILGCSVPVESKSAAVDCNDPYRELINKNVFIRSVTHHYTGRLVRVASDALVLEDAAWIADDGRFADAVSKGTFNEVEPYPDGQLIVGRGAIVDCWCLPVGVQLPRKQK